MESFGVVHGFQKREGNKKIYCGGIVSIGLCSVATASCHGIATLALMNIQLSKNTDAVLEYLTPKAFSYLIVNWRGSFLRRQAHPRTRCGSKLVAQSRLDGLAHPQQL
jgi:hypothetical protein